ncbi:FAD-binding protein [Rhizobium sp. LEGMi198b]
MNFSPSSEREAAELIRTRCESRKPIRILGANTRSAVDLSNGDVLDTAELKGIVDYDPSEMVMTAKAGTPMAEIEAALASNKQHLAFEPVDLRPVLGTKGEPTIGGAMATNSSGPARFINGAARDHLLGLRFVNGAGEIVNAGGRVMKNVTGLDLPKLLAGSRGDLGFITEVTFKVLPRPQISSTVIVSCNDDARAAKVMAAALRLPVSVSGAAHVPADLENRALIGALPEEGAVLLRLEGLAPSVAERVRKLSAAMASFGPISSVEGDASVSIWHAIRNALPFSRERGKTLWRVSLTPMSAHRFVAAVGRDAAISTFYDWQGGLVWLETAGPLDGQTVHCEIQRAGGGHAVLIRATADAVRQPASLSPALQALSTRIKAALDPQTIFSPTFMARY